MICIALPNSKSLLIRSIMAYCYRYGQIPALEGNLPSDVQVMMEALQAFYRGERAFYMADAGTPFRFFMAFLAAQSGKFRLSGTERLLERPHQELAEALQVLGAQIQQHPNGEWEIEGGNLKSALLHISGKTSSQFTSALLLLGSTFAEGLEIRFAEKPLSFPYIELTASILRNYGHLVELTPEFAKVHPSASVSRFEADLVREADWSAAAFFYAAFLLSPEKEIWIDGLRLNSAQGDRWIAAFFLELGVESVTNEQGVLLKKSKVQVPHFLELDMVDVPDLVPVIILTLSVLRIPCLLKNVDHLVMKESNRLAAMSEPLEKLGVVFSYSEGAFRISPKGFSIQAEALKIHVHKDHRIAMSFALLPLVGQAVELDDKTCVEKSFPDFWTQIQAFYPES